MTLASDNDSRSPHVAVIGAGPAGLIAAQTLAEAGCRVTIFERMASPARKFLLAGRGGLNLTHSEPRERFLARYGAAVDWLTPMLDAFPPSRLRALAEELGEPTFVGSSGRIFPESFKASPLLRAWLARLDGLGVRLATRHLWTGWDGDGRLTFETPEGDVAIRADTTILALGGASWPRLGSDGGWVPVLAAAGVGLAPLEPANAGLRIDWSPLVAERFAGTPLKRIALTLGDRQVRGEAVVTEGGLEGGAVYALGGAPREAIAREGQADLRLDLRPDLSEEQIATRLAAARKGETTANRLRKAAGLVPVAVALMREAGPLPAEPAALARLVKAVPLRVNAVAPIGRAISSAGGVMRGAVDGGLMLRARPGCFVAGEMLDWEAPTGGYLLQVCFATGHAAARGALGFLGFAEPPAWLGGW
ncbi:TIGR03862 family flavoprotein, partial [Bosea sp. 117]|uniref:TIGR03862 family flavoprotein n=1 Tax=Bosea sp. 117 TaxID=1125973 RepID=UPI000493E7E6